MADEQGFLTLQDIKTAKDVSTAIIEVPEWGGKIEVQTLDVQMRMDTIRQCSKPDGRGGTTVDQVKMQTSTIVACCLKPKLTADAVDWLTKKNAGAVERIFTKIYQLSGLLPEENEISNIVNRVRAKLQGDSGLIVDESILERLGDYLSAAIEEERSQGGPSPEDFSEAPSED